MIKIEVPPSVDKIFALSTTRHLLGKLSWEIRQFELPPTGKFDAHMVSAYRAFNCAVTAWHMADWAWAELEEYKVKQAADWKERRDAKRQFMDFHRENSREVHLCAEIANRSKHRAQKGGDPDVSVKLMWDFSASNARDGLSKTTLCFLDKGELRPAGEVFWAAFEYWRRYLSAEQLIEATFVFPEPSLDDASFDDERS